MEPTQLLNRQPLTTSKNSRKVQHYGYKYNVNEKTDDIPECLIPYKNILSEMCSNTYNFNQCIY
jgi:hypothetical protein